MNLSMFYIVFTSILPYNCKERKMSFAHEHFHRKCFRLQFIMNQMRASSLKGYIYVA